MRVIRRVGFRVVMLLAGTFGALCAVGVAAFGMVCVLLCMLIQLPMVIWNSAKTKGSE
jgi:hypothetical protein